MNRTVDTDLPGFVHEFGANVCEGKKVTADDVDRMRNVLFVREFSDEEVAPYIHEEYVYYKK